MLDAAQLDFTPEGPVSPRYRDRYHGAVGALAQASAVFLGGCGLPDAWRGRAAFTVVETGFGLGFNFLATWQAWRQDPAHSGRLDFLSIERHPVPAAALARAHAAEPSLADLARALRLALPPRLPGCHRLEFEQGRVTLTLVYGDGAAALAELDACADALFLDGFAPDRNPELWSAPVLAELARLARPGTRLATWCATGALRRALAGAGFAVHKATGIGGKREITLATRQAGAPSDSLAGPAGAPAGPAGTLAGPAAPGPAGSAEVLILGAGLAGCQLAEQLCRRGWTVTLIDAEAGPAQAASGNAAGVVRPLLSRDDNRVTRWTRAAFLYALQRWQPAQGARLPGWHPVGALQLARDPEQAAQWSESLATLDLPGEYVQLLDAGEARRRSGLAPAAGGLLFPLAGWAAPPRLCAESLAHCGPALRCCWHAAVAGLRPGGPGWQAWDAQGRLIAQAPTVVLATGAGVQDGPGGPDFLPQGFRALQALRGEVTRVQASALAALDLVLCGDGYLTANGDGSCSVGATYDRSGDRHASAAGTAANLAHLQALSGVAAGAASVLDGRASWRSIAPDRQPLVGADPQRPGLWHLRAFASRGLVWAPLAAAVLAAEMNHEAAPLARSLRPLLSPARPILQETASP